MRKYHQEFNQPQNKRHDVSKYIRLSLHQHSTDFDEKEEHVGYRSATLRKVGDPIKLENIFKPLPDSQTEPRCVAVIGVPGAGKTLTCYHLLQQFVEQNLFLSSIRFVFFIILRILNTYKEPVSFRSLVLDYHGPSLSSESDIWSHLCAHQSQVLFVIDGYDELSGLGRYVNRSYHNTFSNLTKDTAHQRLVYNLIKGTIFPDAKVVVTSRPHRVTDIKECAPRVRLLNLDGLGKKM